MGKGSIMVQVSLDALHATVKGALMAHGADAFPAAEVARAVAASESMGDRRGGLDQVEIHCQQLRGGRVRGDVTPTVSTPRPSAVHVDAHFGFAQPAFAYGLPVALDAARQSGVATLAVSHAHACGALGYFTRQIAAAGFVGIGFANGVTALDRTPVIGGNPIAFSVPDGAGGIALHVDEITHDPAALRQVALRTDAGNGGQDISLMVELLATAMTGGILSRDVDDPASAEGAPHDLGQYYLVIDPSASAAFGARLADLAGAGPRKPADPVEVDPALWARIEALAAR